MIDDDKSTIHLAERHDPYGQPLSGGIAVEIADDDFPGRILAWLSSPDEFVGIDFISDDPIDDKALEVAGRRMGLYRDYAQAWARYYFENPGDNREISAVMRRLKLLGNTKRGLGEDFYRAVAEEHAALVAAGEPHINKALAAKYHVDKSRPSRWIGEARRRGFIDD